MQRKSTKQYFVYYKEIFWSKNEKRQKAVFECPVKIIPISDNRRMWNNRGCSFVHPGHKSSGLPRLNSWQ